jgi:hypothetical protein
MNRDSFVIALLTCFLGATSAIAHQPVLVSPEHCATRVEQPEVSQAFYGELRGREARFTISSPKPFRLFVEVLAPDIAGARRDFRADIRGTKTGRLASLEKPPDQWKTFYEPYAGDEYHRGPEFVKDVPAGDYEIVVTNPELRGKYVLTLGEREVFTANQILRTIVLLPTLKHDYFGRSYAAAFWNRSGLFMLVILVLAGATVAAAWFKLRRACRRLRSTKGNLRTFPVYPVSKI